MAGLKKFVNDLIQQHDYGKLIGTVAQIENRVDEAETDITSLKTVKANMYIVDTASNIGATTKKIGDIELAPGDFVLDTATPKLWIVKANGTNKYITLS